MLGPLHPRIWWRAAVLDGLLPITVLAAVSAWLAGPLFGALDRLVVGGGTGVTPSDVNGTLWFYWWTQNALNRGVDLLTPDVICAPTGQALGSNFPQHVDAMMAAPLFDALPFPSSYNLWVFSVPVISGLAAHVAARWLGLNRALALMVAVLFGFNAFSIHELANGKPASALVFTLPLFMAAWLRCLTTPGRRVWPWLVVAGFSAALAIQHYVLYAMFAAAFGAVVLIAHLVRPSPGCSRRRPLMAGLVVLLIGITLSAPYLKRLLGERRPMVAAAPLSLTDPAVLREQGESMDIGYPIRVDSDETLPRRGAFPTILTLMALLLIPLGGKRHRAWLLGAVGFYLVTLGPMAAWSVRPEVEWMRIAGRGVPLPTWGLNKIFPFSIQFFHPGRAFPVVVLCAAMSVGFGLQAVIEQWKRAKRWLPLLVGAAVAWVGMVQVYNQGGLVLLYAPWTPHAFITQLAEAEDKQAIIEFPVGLGHATAPAQLVHGWRRSESHHDYVSALQADRPPDDCLQLPFLQALWDISRGAPLHTQPNADRPIASAQDPAAIRSAHDAGFRYVVGWRAGFDVLRQAGIDVDREQAIGQVTKVLGNPIVSDETLSVWRIPANGVP